MSNNIVPSIETLPAEILHRIFDHLDISTMLVSIRSVSKLFRSVVNSYNRYVLDFNFISKSNYYVFCRLIHPEHIISLIFSSDEHTADQIDLFVTLIRFQELTRLRSLTLHNIDEGQLNFVLKHINRKILTSLSCTIRKYDDKQKKTTKVLLSSIVAQSALCRLELNINSTRMSEISWPIHPTTIQYLTVNSYINIDDLCKILQCSPHLYTLIMKEIPRVTVNSLPILSFRQLTSLTIKNLSVAIHEVELFLLLTPSLIYLNLIGGKNMLDGKRWEQLIQINLPKLKTFEFYFDEWISTKVTPTDLGLIIASFQTPFWVQHKKGFVTCEYNINWPTTIYLYSIPICKSFMCYTRAAEIISLSTYPMMMNNYLSITHNISSFSIILNKLVADSIQEKKGLTNHPLFPKVTEIELQICEDWPLLSLQSLSMFIDISRIIRMEISSEYFINYNENTWMDIGIVMKQARNLSSLIIQRRFFKYIPSGTIQNIHSIIPCHVKDLQIPIDDLDQINMILERCKNLSTIKFDIEDTEFCEKVIAWFSDNTIVTQPVEKVMKLFLFGLENK